MNKPPAWLWYFLAATIVGSVAHFPKYPSGTFWDMLRSILYLTALWLGLAGVVGLVDHIAQLYAMRITSIQQARVAGQLELLRVVHRLGESMKGLNPSVAVVLAQHLIEIEDNTWMLRWLDEIEADPTGEDYLLFPVIRNYPENSREYNELMALSEFLVGKGLMYRRVGRRHQVKSREALSTAYKYATRGKESEV